MTEMFVEYSVEEDGDETLSGWAEASSRTLSNLSALDSSEMPVIPNIKFPSLEEMVEEEIVRRLKDSDVAGKSLQEISQEREAALSHWETQRVKSHWASADDSRLKFQLPHTNAISVEKLHGDEIKSYVFVQVYKTINYRQTKIFELRLSLDETVEQMVSQIDIPQMFDAPLYAQGGLVVTPYAMYGDRAYAEPYQIWLTQTGLPQRPLLPMNSVKLGSLPLRLVTNCEPCYLECLGDEKFTLFFTNVESSSSVSPNLVYKRKQHRVVRCILCQSRPAHLVVVNDEFLPKNPAHACSQCYRRLRSDMHGQFIDPPETALVSAFSQV